MKIGKVIASGLICSMLIAGCGKSPEVVDNYPGVESNTTTEAKTEKKVSPVSEIKKSEDGNHISYNVTNERGAELFTVDADIVADYEKSYPVYDVSPWQMQQSQVGQLATVFFDKDTTSVLMPIEIADETYLTQRLAVLNERLESYNNSAEEAPKAITKEIDKINEVLNGPADRYMVACPAKPTWVDLTEYYEAKGSVGCEVKFCFVEGEIDGNLVRMDIIEHANNMTIRVYRQNESYDMPDLYNLIGDISYVPDAEDCALTKEEGARQAENLIERLSIGKITAIDTEAAYIYGTEPEVAGDYQMREPGFVTFFSIDNGGKSRPATSCTDFYSCNNSTTNCTLNADNILHADEFEEQTREYDSLYSASGDRYSGYDSTAVCIDEKGIVEIYFTNAVHKANLSVTKTTLLDFDSIDERARKFFATADKYDESFSYSVNAIDRIELGLCRTILENGKYFMVPGWYYLMKPSDGEVLPTPAVVINAIDGSIIDAKRGGIVIDM